MSKKGKIRKNVVRGIAHVKATQNNTIVTITDMNGEALAWDSAGTIGFKGTRKSTPFAATRAGEQCGQKVRKIGMTEVEVRITGAGAGRATWSATGWIAFNSQHGIEQVNARGEQRRVLLQDDSHWAPTWSR